MKVHANAALGPAGRLALCELIESGMTLRAAAAALNVAPATAHRWWHRCAAASEMSSPRGPGFGDRSSRPHRQPRRLSARRGGADPAGRAGRPASARDAWPGSAAGPARRSGRCLTATASRGGRRAPRQSYRRYEWSRPGALLHVDIAQLARFDRPGHRGHRSLAPRPARNRAGVGCVYLHACVDDRSRYAYVEQHPR